MTHPYSDLPASAFWRAAVAETPAAQVTDIYRAKFVLTADMAIATAGSCFAQHVGRTLRRAGLTVLDAEPAPAALPADMSCSYGFNLYSGRYGNIYTVRQMVQLLYEIGAGEPDAAHVWTRDGRYHDALRPGLDPQGLDSSCEVLALRRRHLSRLAPMLRRADLFVFTLGLTEAWRCRRSGRIYPSCPGVIAGCFDPEQHEFVNFRYGDVVADLEELRRLLQGFNPQMRLLLTVSPVPLAATATGGHVLPATQWSKATLRAAAGDVADAYPDVDYFPSYEIVTNPAARGAFFAPGLRQVTAQGVAEAMGAFLAAHELSPGEDSADAALVDPDEVICEEALLEAFGK